MSTTTNDTTVDSSSSSSQQKQQQQSLINNNKTTTATDTKDAVVVTKGSGGASAVNDEESQHNNNHEDPQGKSRLNRRAAIKMMIHRILQQWKGSKSFLLSQGQVLIVLSIAYIGDNWPTSYPRNDNHNMTLFWGMNLALFIAALCTMQHKPGREGTVQLLSRSQTEEWKGWMQWAFIMYHYYRAYSVYNAIRCFVSAYVWMTGFGNFLYFDKKQDFSMERAISMWLRINYFPILLSYFVGVPMDLLYIVPLHTTAFFITMATCYLALKLESYSPSWSSDKRNVVAIAICLLAHIVLFETPLVNILKLFSNEILFRFSADKYSAVLGIMSGYGWSIAQRFITATHVPANDDGTYTPSQIQAAWGQRAGGVALIAVWWILFGHISDKYTYNPIHPFIFWMPVFGWLALRNGSKYLTEIHSTALEFFGKITLETYVLQFHVFMCRKVQHIPVVIPGSDKDGPALLKFINMLVTGIGFVALAYWARQITVTTQTTVTDLIVLLRRGPSAPPTPTSSDPDKSEMEALTKSVDGQPEPTTITSTNGTNGTHNDKILHAKESGDV